MPFLSIHQSLEIEDFNGNAEIPVEVQIEGDAEMRFSYILGNIWSTLFLSCSRISKHAGSTKLPPIIATIAAGDNAIGMRITDQGGGLLTLQNSVQNPADLFSFSHIRNSARMEHSRLLSLRTASSYHQGIWAAVNEQVENWQCLPNPEKEDGVERHARMGIGLPMSNIFATYFGGSLGPAVLEYLTEYATRFNHSVPALLNILQVSSIALARTRQQKILPTLASFSENSNQRS
ncbi:hypothetical protein F5050DRAFT_1317299 [Lentinula boryana]|uniref:Protein-serine/threonine kinase n=1 Tax=Lentinula boryana TaxID=40481 RepID=A0ABQ8PXD9_9AGAR|nr:hypothetical protein F5050DRAFT_1317299 [Lentinula boryana]